MSTCDRLLADCRELQRRGLLSSSELNNFTPFLTSPSSPPSDAVRSRVSSLLLQDIHATIERVRLQRNEHEQKSVGTSELAAVAVGGALGALHAWLRSPADAAPPTLWTSAVDGAAASLAVAKRKRSVQPLQLQLLSGDAATCRHVVLCVNGFMTQRNDATRTWRAWTLDDRPDVAVFAVQWEAGDVGAWHAFCAQVNDRAVSASALATLTHFTGNPWHRAQGQAEQVGALLAHVLAARPALLRDRTLSLLGHSLGGAVVYSTCVETASLRAQLNEDDHVPWIASAVSFAGAFVVSERIHDVAKGLDPRRGTFVNVFSTRDHVLSKLFWVLQLPSVKGLTTASAAAIAGCQAIAFSAPNCVNVDVSDLVAPSVDNHFGHSYAPVMDAIKTRVQPHLVRP